MPARAAPDWTLPEVLAAHAELDFMKFEAFISWVKSALDVTADPITYVEMAGRYGMRYTSMHLPPVGDDLDESLAGAIRAARFARQLGADVVLFKATSRPNYVRAAPVFLDAIAGLGLTAVIQNHCGSPLNDVDDVIEVLRGVGDERLKVLLEVGHFHQAGVTWDRAYDAFAERLCWCTSRTSRRASRCRSAPERSISHLWRRLSRPTDTRATTWSSWRARSAGPTRCGTSARQWTSSCP